MNHRFLVLVFLFSGVCLNGQSLKEAVSVTFRVDMNGVEGIEGPVGIRGSTAPLSWENTLPLKDEDMDGVYEGKVTFQPSVKPEVAYKFVYGSITWELNDGGNRLLFLDNHNETLPIAKWDERQSFNQALLAGITITPEKMLEDFKILKRGLKALHPGLYRYSDSLTMEQYFNELEGKLNREHTIGSAYLEISKFLAKIKCGHTYANFWNQPEIVKASVIDNNNKVPFTFRVIQKRMIVMQNSSENELLDPGAEVTHINGVPVSAILDQLITTIKSDGSNDFQRIYETQLFGLDTYESFDIYFPLLFPPNNGEYEIKGVNIKNKTPFSTSVKSVSRKERLELLTKKYGPQPDTYDGLWEFKLLDDQTAYLKMGTFVTWKMKMNWKKFIADAFATVREKGIQHLIIDIRGNGGGDPSVGGVVASYLIEASIEVENYQPWLRYDKVPEDLLPFVGTWDNSYKDLTKKVKSLEGGYYTWKKEEAMLVIKPEKKPFKGSTYLLVDAANSSATFTLAMNAKKYGIATLVGEPTGGNKRGINGGMMFFTNLPNSKIEFDIPLMAYMPGQPQPDEGIFPDVEVSPKVEDVANGVDTVLEAALELVEN